MTLHLLCITSKAKISPGCLSLRNQQERTTRASTFLQDADFYDFNWKTPSIRLANTTFFRSALSPGGFPRHPPSFHSSQTCITMQRFSLSSVAPSAHLSHAFSLKISCTSNHILVITPDTSGKHYSRTRIII